MIAESIEKLSNVHSSENPFPGLRPFELHESHLFFGREGQSEKLLAKLEATRFLAVVGTSGSGKSSLVRAGLVPALLGGMMVSAGSNWRVALLRPSNDPIGNLARGLSSPEVFGSDISENAESQARVAAATLRRGNLGLVEAVRLALQTADENLLMVVDQFEELFRFAREAESTRYENDAAAFVKLLLEPSCQYQLEQEELRRKLQSIEGLLRHQKLSHEEARREEASVREEARKRDLRIYVVLTMRSDFLGDCAKFWDLPEAVNESQYLIPRLTRHQLREAIAGPVAVGGGQIAPRLVSQLLNDIGDNQDQLPVLQHALMRTWGECRQRKHDHVATPGEIDVCCYEAIGGMKEALSRHAGEAYSELDARHQKIAERMFKALTERGDDNREIRRPATLGALAAIADAGEDEVKTVIEKFRQPGRSFLMPPAGTPLHSDTLTDISHESLIRVWKILQQWVNEEAESATIYRRLAETAALHGKGEAELLGKLDLKPVLKWRKKNEPNLHWAARYESGLRYKSDLPAALSFLEASKKNRADEIAEHRRSRREKAEQGQRQLAQAQALAEAQSQAADAERQKAEEQTKAASRLRRFLAALVVAVLLALVAAGLALSAYRRANAEKANANSTAYIANMNLSRSEFERGNHQRGFELLSAYLPATNAAQDQSGLRSFYWYYLWRQNNRDYTLTGHRTSVFSVAFAPDGRTLASASGDRSVKLWDVQSRKEVATLTGYGAVVRSVAFAPDGRTLASAGGDESVKLWDVQSRKEVATLTGHGAFVWSVAFAPDGRTLASASEDKSVKLWDVQSRKEVATLTGHGAVVRSVAFAPDGRTLASASYDKSVKLWDVQSRKEVATLTGHGNSVLSVAFVPDGRTLASASEDRSVKLWDVQSRKEVATLTGHGNSVLSVAFASDGRTLASASEDRSVKLWDVQSRKEVATLTGHEAYVFSVAFAPDGRTLASASDDNSAKLWDVQSCKEVATLTGHGDNVWSVAFAPDGRTLASASADKSVKLWDVQSRKEVATLTGHGDNVWSVAFAPDGRTLASASADKSVKLWDVQSRKEVATLTGHGAWVWSVAFAPDGRTLASASDDKSVKLWDVQSRKEVATLTGHGNYVRSVAFAPDGRTLASASDDKLVKLWDVQSRKEVATLTGHGDSVRSVAFAPDGRTLASASEDKSVKLWDVQSRKEVATLTGHGDSVRSVAFAPDGRTLASASDDRSGSVKLWDGATDKDIEDYKPRK